MIRGDTRGASPIMTKRMSELKFAQMLSSPSRPIEGRRKLRLSGPPPSMPVPETAVVMRSPATPAAVILVSPSVKKPLSQKAARIVAARAKIAAAKAKTSLRLAQQKVKREEAMFAAKAKLLTLKEKKAAAIVEAKAKVVRSKEQKVAKVLAIKEKKAAAIVEAKAKAVRSKEHKAAKSAFLKAKKLVKPAEAKHRKLTFMAKQVAAASAKKFLIAEKMRAAAEQVRNKANQANQAAEAARDLLSKAVATMTTADAYCKEKEPPKRSMRTVIKTIMKKPAGGRKR